MGSSRFKDSHIILGLLTALAVETLLLLWHADVITWSSHVIANGEKPAGLIAKAENQLHRRGLNSLVWEKSEKQESVYYYDSLLTLAQSTATLNLEQSTEVTLSENTLVTLEPPDEKRIGEIRLKFSKGNLQARNPYARTHIQGDDFSVELKPGSDLQLRKVGEKDFEIRVSKGEAQVVGPDGTHQVSRDKLLRLSQGKGKSVSMAKDLRWVKPPPPKVYTHDKEISVEVNWEGDGEELVVQTPSAPEWKINLTPSMRGMRVPLPPGQHVVYLRSKDRTSAPLDVQVWQAPVVHLIMPLPRNRLRTEETAQFLWQRWPEASGYVFKVEGVQHNISKDLQLNTYETVFKEEDDAKWGVWVKDKDGNLIPPLYTYPLYIRHKPLAAPRLNSPQLRQPAQVKDKGAQVQPVRGLSHDSFISRSDVLLKNVWKLILPSAHAQGEPTFEALFSWYPVDGANYYFIEISETPDFRTPIVSAKTSKVEFSAKGLKQKTYYWRVAAGHSSGRMGLFSEPAAVEVRAAVQTPPPVPQPAPVATPDQLLSQQSQAQHSENTSQISKVQPSVQHSDTQGMVQGAQAKEEPLHSPVSGRFFWRGGYGILKGKAPNTVYPELSGAKPLGFGVAADVFKQKDSWWSIGAIYGQVTDEPNPKEDFPFQPEIILQQFSVSATRIDAFSPWGYGISAQSVPVFSRVNLEEFKVDPEIAFGPHMQGQWNLGTSSSYVFGAGLMISSAGWSISNSHRLTTHPFDNSLFMGVGAEVFFLSDKEYSVFSADGFLIIGLEF